MFTIIPSNTAGPAVCPDLLASDSIAVLAPGGSNGGPVVFANREVNIITDDQGNLIIDLRNTTWDIRDAKHVTDNGIVNYRSWWQRPVGDPEAETPQGIVCLTGPNGNVSKQLDVLIAQINNGSDPDDGEWYVVESGGARRFCIAFSLCNK